MSAGNRLLKYGIHGGAVYAGLKYVTGADAVRLGGTEIPLVVFGLGLGALSSAANDLLHSVVLPYVSPDQKLRSMESTATSLGAGALTMLGGVMLAEPKLVNEIGKGKVMMLGAIAEVFSQYAYEQSAQWFGVKQDDLLF